MTKTELIGKIKAIEDRGKNIKEMLRTLFEAKDNKVKFCVTCCL